MNEAERLAELRGLLQQGGGVRIDLAFAFSTKGAHPTARLYRREGKRWVKVEPLLLPPDGGTHADLLENLAALARTEPS